VAIASVSDLIEQLRGIDLERRLGLRPDYPRVALEFDRKAMTLVRLKAKRRGRPMLESYRVQTLAEPEGPATISDPALVDLERLQHTVRELFETAGVRPGKVSVVLPDNLAKLALLTLPERPPSRRQLEEVIRFKTRRGVPFKVADAAMSYQLLPSEGKSVSILVALIRRALIERYEHALEAIGARPGLVDLCTPNLLNLCRDKIEAAAGEGDVALLNCAGTYFSLAIIRRSGLAFVRCKSYAMGNGSPEPSNGQLARELGYSMSYYEEKLGGQGIRTLFVRSVEIPFEQLGPQLAALEAERVEPIDPVAALDAGEGGPVDRELAQRLAPALGAALGRA
jgi:hypothetical protein